MKKYAVEIFLLSIALLLVLVLLIVSNNEGPSGPGWEGVPTDKAQHQDHKHDEWSHGDEHADPSSDKGKEW